MRAFAACAVYGIMLACQGLQTLLLYYSVTGSLINARLAVLLFVPVFIITYWLRLIFEALVKPKNAQKVKGSAGTVIRVRQEVLPKKIKNVLSAVSVIWSVGIIIVWIYFFIRYSMWYI